MEGLLITLAIKFALNRMAQVGGNPQVWDTVKADFAKWVKGETWEPQWAMDEEITVGNAVLDDVAKACQDTADLQAVMTALAAKDFTGAEAALRAMLVKVAGANPYVAALLKSA